MPILGFGEGWQEPEYEPARGISWRWASGKADAAGLAVRPRRRAADRRRVAAALLRPALARRRHRQAAPSSEASTPAATSPGSFRVPAPALQASGGAITIETDQFFRPADRGQGADKRALGLRIYLVKLKPAS
ncbi:MAG: hypothetical protein MZU84_04535 [Sphingobacterium sp.]|nr:hypothetical protein [Sphingobacterium sp.]